MISIKPPIISYLHAKCFLDTHSKCAISSEYKTIVYGIHIEKYLLRVGHKFGCNPKPTTNSILKLYLVWVHS